VISVKNQKIMKGLTHL